MLLMLYRMMQFMLFFTFSAPLIAFVLLQFEGLLASAPLLLLVLFNKYVGMS